MKQYVYRNAIRLAAFSLIPLGLGLGCAKEKSRIPTWIQVDSLGLTTTPAQGSNSHRFTDAWVYADGNLVGAFELPARVPVLPQGEGSTNIIVYPGVQLNGLTALRTPYLKTVRYESEINLIPGETVAINPTYAYDTLVSFIYQENFEGFGSSVDRSEGAYGEFEVKQDNPATAFEGGGCGIIRHSGAENTITQIETNTWFTLPKGDVGGIFFEFNYNCNTSFTVSLLCRPAAGGIDTKTGIIGLNATYGEWKKIYIALSPVVNGYTIGNQFKPVIGYTRQTDIATQEVYIDNLKILY